MYLLYRGFRDRAYFAGLPQRLGFIPYQATGAVWVHAVSVGEVLTAVELIRRFRAGHPRVPVYLSTTTLAGCAAAQKLDRGVFFAPLDYRSSVRRVLRRLRPALVVILETEIWPNLYREARRAGASLLVVNGRISDRALPRYRRWRALFRYALQWPDAILAQSEEDRRRFEIAGAPAQRVFAAGNLKYDFTPPSTIAPDLAAFLDGVKPEAVWIAASTMTDGQIDEEDAVIAAASSMHGVLTILAPRKPDRFGMVAEKLERAGVSFARRSRLPAAQAPRVLLLDSIGELAALFARADAVFMGGTLANRGGHNILEPAYFGKPIVIGPHMENFAAIEAEFREALVRIETPAGLGPAIAALLQDAPRRALLGELARAIAMSKRGASARVLEQIERAYALGVPNPPRTLPARVLFTPLSWLWIAGNRLNRMRTPRALATPVISIGALSMGGAGKTPVTAHFAAKMRLKGAKPAILTRGYGRRSSEMVIVPRGGSASVDRTGDEAQIFIRAGDAHVGVGADRFAIGEKMERELAPGVFLLDDGFQHWRLARTHEIVLIDALDPLGGGVFPLGRLREPWSALARADTVVVTRAEGRTDGIEKLIARYNARAAVFRARVKPLGWFDRESGERAAPPARVAAFCGLGSPLSFWRTLDELGIEASARRAFRDHHRYAVAELESLARGVDALVTTEKDAMNLPARLPLRIYWLKIGIEIEREEELLNRIL